MDEKRASVNGKYTTLHYQRSNIPRIHLAVRSIYMPEFRCNRLGNFKLKVVELCSRRWCKCKALSERAATTLGDTLSTCISWREARTPTLVKCYLQDTKKKVDAIAALSKSREFVHLSTADRGGMNLTEDIVVAVLGTSTVLRLGAWSENIEKVEHAR